MDGKRKRIRLTARERAELERFSTTGVRSVRLVNRAKIILALDTSADRTPERQEALAKRIGVNRRTVNDAKRDFMARTSISGFLRRKKRETPPVPPKITGEMEARIIALACGKAPKGYARWTLRMLADKCVELRYSDAMSHMTISRLLKKRNLNLT
ncbi:helix-turn-helix domain-containing protein [Treponema sp. R80B11-R83G3]